MENKKRKIGTLTFHIAHNYGAMLQAYALPIAVRKIGYECEVIDYRFPYIDRWSRIERLDDLVAQYGAIGGSMRYVKRLVTGYYNKNDSHSKFDYFERNIIPHSKRVYRSKEELNNMPYNAILFGSDQIWNSALTNGVAEEYLGGFECLPGTKKIAYAASCGTADFQPDSKEIYNKYLKDFSSIGVREKEFQDTLQNRGFDAECVLDPTLLLSAEEWKEIIPNRSEENSKKYLLVYAFDVEDIVFDLAREYASKEGLEIVTIAYKETPAMYGMQVKTDCGPLEFLSLFANAEHVIAASFHGTVFSIILHKDFHCVPHPKYRERTDSLLSMFDLTDHNIDLVSELHDVHTDWDKVDELMHAYREDSFLFLQRAIGSPVKEMADNAK